MVVDPWGAVLADAGEPEGVVTADLDLAAQERVRKELPSLEHLRHDLFAF